jgi:hypothetical protein
LAHGALCQQHNGNCHGGSRENDSRTLAHLVHSPTPRRRRG